MLGQSFCPTPNPQLRLQVEADQAVVSENVASKRRARLLWMGCGFAVLMLCCRIGASAGAILHPASYASPKPPNLSLDVAFNPTLPALHPAIGHARSTALRLAAIPGVRQRKQRQPSSGPRMSGAVDEPVGEQVSRRAALLAAAAASMLSNRASAETDPNFAVERPFRVDRAVGADKPFAVDGLRRHRHWSKHTPDGVRYTGTSNVSPSLPGTATQRLEAARDRARSLNGKLTGDWEGIRKQLLYAAGLADVGETSHCFSDFNHVSATTMAQAQQENLHDGKVQGMAAGNQLGPVIKLASLREGKGFEKDGSWCTCALGAGKEPPFDVAHHQFKSEVAFYLVWKEGGGKFALVTEQGDNLACGEPTGKLPSKDARKLNWQIFTEEGAGKIAQAALRC